MQSAGPVGGAGDQLPAHRVGVAVQRCDLRVVAAGRLELGLESGGDVDRFRTHGDRWPPARATAGARKAHHQQAEQQPPGDRSDVGSDRGRVHESRVRFARARSYRRRRTGWSGDAELLEALPQKMGNAHVGDVFVEHDLAPAPVVDPGAGSSPVADTIWWSTWLPTPKGEIQHGFRAAPNDVGYRSRDLGADRPLAACQRRGDAWQRPVAPMAPDRIGVVQPQVVGGQHVQRAPVFPPPGGDVLKRRKRARQAAVAANPIRRIW